MFAIGKISIFEYILFSPYSQESELRVEGEVRASSAENSLHLRAAQRLRHRVLEPPVHLLGAGPGRVVAPKDTTD